ncbi:hypothetical protein AXG93_2865s1110 [Marchantia polymorpha subsp. ruderalis]|uniref:Uncharacterized protein n=1 Tax=Marchantia polymorpha subsp. ruderalis TaxID=1480154 RepID=A0A176W6K4_MARPO|nr:hypothetical protein AXG93_2865s1110 [Marchantia polymorpha subsp. ruderalis]
MQRRTPTHRRKEFVVGGKSAGKSAFGGRNSPARRHFAIGGISAFGPRSSPSGVKLVRRLRRQRIKISRLRRCAYGDAPTPTDNVRDLRRRTSSALAVSAYAQADGVRSRREVRRELRLHRKEFAYGRACGRMPTAVRDGCEDGFLLFDSESVKVTKAEDASFVDLFKREKSNKNGYRTRDYKDRFRRNVAMALLQLLQPHRTTYITSWQVSFVELTLAGAPVHWSRILHKVTLQQVPSGQPL